MLCCGDRFLGSERVRKKDGEIVKNLSSVRKRKLCEKGVHVDFSRLNRSPNSGWEILINRSELGHLVNGVVLTWWTLYVLRVAWQQTIHYLYTWASFIQCFHLLLFIYLVILANVKVTHLDLHYKVIRFSLHIE